MDHRFRLKIGHTSLDFIFILALLCVFAFGALMAVILGSNTYKEIKDNMDSNYELRTPLSYISTKIRQHDDADSIQIITKEGTDALVLESLDAGVLCQTWIYEYNDSLYEVYLDKGTEFNLEDGIAIVPSYGLAFDLENNLLKVEASDHQGNTRSLSLSFRTDQGGES